MELKMEQKKGTQPYYFKNKPLLRTKVAVFGQGAGKIGDIFAQFQTHEGKAAYKVFALNSNDADLASLQYILPENRVSLNLDGLGKNPERATRLFRRSVEAQDKIATFVDSLNHNEDGSVDDLHLYIATMGGGTGTSTIVEAVKAHHKRYVAPVAEKLVQEKLQAIQEKKLSYSSKEELMLDVTEEVAEKVPKIGLILVTPPYREGAETLRQSYNYCAELWKLATNLPFAPIGFLNFPDNEHFFQAFKQLSADEQLTYKSVNHWTNEQIAYAFHGVLTACGLSESSKLLDRTDMKRLLLEGVGTLTFSYSTNLNLKKDASIAEIVSQFEKLIDTNILHKTQPLTEVVDGVTTERKFTNLGVISVTDIAAGKIDGETASANVLEMLSRKLNVVGNVFDSFLSTVNGNESHAYLLYKFNSLPAHIEELTKEYEAVTARASETEGIQVAVSTINKGVDFNMNAASLFKEVVKPKEPEMSLEQFFPTPPEKQEEDADAKVEEMSKALGDLMNSLKTD